MLQTLNLAKSISPSIQRLASARALHSRSLVSLPTRRPQASSQHSAPTGEPAQIHIQRYSTLLHNRWCNTPLSTLSTSPTLSPISTISPLPTMTSTAAAAAATNASRSPLSTMTALSAASVARAQYEQRRGLRHKWGHSREHRRFPPSWSNTPNPWLVRVDAARGVDSDLTTANRAFMQVCTLPQVTLVTL